MNVMKFGCVFMTTAIFVACQHPWSGKTQVELSGSGFGVTLGSRFSSDAKSAVAEESEAAMGKWASYQKRGGAHGQGWMAQPGAEGVDWTAVTGGPGVITVTRLASIPGGATQMLFRAKNTSSNIMERFGNATLTGLVPGQTYQVQASWFDGGRIASEWSEVVVVAAGS